MNNEVEKYVGELVDLRAKVVELQDKLSIQADTIYFMQRTINELKFSQADNIQYESYEYAQNKYDRHF